MRSGQFKNISVSPIYKGQLVSQNPLTGFVFDFEKKESDEVIGYASFFQLINGFEKTFFMTKEEVTKHGTKYSQTFRKGFGLWKDDFDAMACKTVLKLLLSKYAPLSIEMQTAITTDGAVVKDVDTNEVDYVDNIQYEDVEVVSEQKENKRIYEYISNCTSLQDLESTKDFLQTEELQTLYNNKHKELSNEF